MFVFHIFIVKKKNIYSENACLLINSLKLHQSEAVSAFVCVCELFSNRLECPLLLCDNNHTNAEDNTQFIGIRNIYA